MYTIKKEIFISILILLTAWMNETLAVLDFCIGLILFYFLFKIIIIYFSRNSVTRQRLQWVLNRFHLFLLLHGLIFILLLIYIDFDFFRFPGDWDEYHYDGNSFSNYLKGLAVFSPLVGDATAYSSLIGLIYYFFSGSVVLAVAINIFFVVTSSIMLYLLLEELFDHRVAKFSLYLSAFYPALFIYEIYLLKECFIFFLMTSLSLIVHRALSNNRKSDIIIAILLFFTLFNVRFFLILPFLMYIFYHFIFVNRRPIIVCLFSAILAGIFFKMSVSTNPTAIGSFRDDIFVRGISITDKTNYSFNYQIHNANPSLIAKAIGNNWKYFIERIPLFYTGVWTLERIYYIPFLSGKQGTVEWWIFDLLNYSTNLIPWLCMFVSLWGFKKIFIDLRKHTAVLWIPIIIIPLIVSIFSNNQRYMFTCIYYTIPCIAYGMVYCRRYKDYLVIASLLIITLVAFINKDTFIFPPLILSLLFFIIQTLKQFKKPFQLSLEKTIFYLKENTS